jgi:hypothetical protein
MNDGFDLFKFCSFFSSIVQTGVIMILYIKSFIILHENSILRFNTPFFVSALKYVSL